MTRAEYLYYYTKIVQQLLGRITNLPVAKRALATLNERTRTAGTLRQMPLKTPKELLEIHGDWLNDHLTYPTPRARNYDEEYDDDDEEYDDDDDYGDDDYHDDNYGNDDEY